MSISVLRRYTPPTCTLEILAMQSPLSRWTDRPVLKNLKFQLRFDDPRLISEDHAVIEGDRAQLDALCDSVTTYVQQLLDPAHVYPYHSRDPELPHAHGRDPDHLDLGDLAAVVTPGRSSVVALRPQATAATIFLRPRGLVSHDLHLGSLAPASSNPVIPLSTLQLFDLSNALDSYAADVVTLPDDVRPAWSIVNAPWLKTAAVFLLAVGVSTSLFQVITNYATAPTETASVDESVDGSVGTTAAPPNAEGLPAAPRAPRQIPPDLRPLPPSAFERPSAGGNAPSAQTRPPAQRAPRRPASDRRGAPQARPTNPAQAVPRLPDFSPVPPQVASVPDDAAGAVPESFGSTTRSTADQMQIEAAPAAPSAATSQLPSLESNSTLAAPSTPSAAPTVTAFDSIPQVAELRTYVENAWTSPEGVTQTLEYRLSVDASGRVENVIPLGESSRIYLTQTGLPSPGQAVVAPLDNAQRAIFRVVLNPQGQVQTFLESLN